ncbi:hypothetical protein HHL17_26840 [Chitinophaga sp. G-6-1-13]|uniref:GNAT family N-acetyltransferase n=1 Tax=Chitinophaga fulva TaxID=2728842 RepID=A0A848GVX6_9BACT|nr:hypothetical protein [Chitinophaga fulva]NML40843.1 hypothetical protein [Chitinophaga fulva]
MQVKIFEVKSGNEISALIRAGTLKEMPSIHDGWQFNFDKELQKLKNASGYLLVTDENPLVVEGCMIFQLIDKKAPYLSMIEVAPHNRNKGKKYDWVAGCLIAYAFMLSVRLGQDYYRAYLQLDVLEEHMENEKKLMEVYSTRYNAKRIGTTTTMVIADEDGEKLVEKYLKRTE